MLGKRTENPRPVLLAEVRDILEARSTQPDFGYEQQTSLDYARKFGKLTLKDAEALHKKMLAIESLKPESACRIVDILPASRPTLLAILLKDKSTLSDSDAAKVMELVTEARTKILPEPEPAPQAAAPSGEAKDEPKAAAKVKAEEKSEPKEKAAGPSVKSEEKSEAKESKKKAKSEGA